MSQKSILSFFKSPPKSSSTKEQSPKKTTSESVQKAETASKENEEPKENGNEIKSPPKPVINEESSKDESPVKIRKTARKGFKSSSKKPEVALAKTTKSPKNVAPVTNGHSEASKPDPEPMDSSSVASPKKNGTKQENQEDAIADASDEECNVIPVSKKRKRNALTDDSPIKNSKKKHEEEKEVKDEEECEMECEEEDISPKKVPELKKGVSKTKAAAEANSQNKGKGKSPKSAGRKKKTATIKVKITRGKRNSDENQIECSDEGADVEVQEANESSATAPTKKKEASDAQSDNKGKGKSAGATGRKKKVTTDTPEGEEHIGEKKIESSDESAEVEEDQKDSTKEAGSKKGKSSDSKAKPQTKGRPGRKKKVTTVSPVVVSTEAEHDEENKMEVESSEVEKPEETNDDCTKEISTKKGKLSESKAKPQTKGKPGRKKKVTTDTPIKSAEENHDDAEETNGEPSSKSVAKASPQNKRAKSKSPRGGRKKNVITSDDDEQEENKSASEQSDSSTGKEKDESKSSDNEADSSEKASSSSQKNSIHSFFSPKPKKEKDEKDTSEKSSKKTSTPAKSGDSGDAYNPTLRNYHPIDDACWKKGEKVPYLALATTLNEIEQISARLKMIEILSNFFRSVIVLTPEDLLCSIYLCLNRLAPEYEGVELGIGEMVLMRALAQATGRSVDKIKAEVVVKGDLGSVAESSRSNQRVMFAFPKLTVSSVFTKFKEISQMTGNTAISKKTDKIQALFAACRLFEAKFIIRSLGGKLRIGLAEQSVLAALARAAVLTPPNQPYPPAVTNAASKMSAETLKEKIEEQALILKSTYCECPNYDLIIPVLLKEGIPALPKHCHLSPGVPLKPMLAHPTKGIEEVLKRFDQNEFTCEFKYDGERAQIHLLESGAIKIYSRNQEDNSSKYPDVIGRLSKSFNPEIKSFILDSEAVAWDKESNEILPFQVLSTRKKKDAVSSEITVQVCIVAFDLLYLNGEPLIKKTLKERRSLLRENFIEVPSEFLFAHSLDGNSAETMQEFLDESIKGKCEGLMVKSLVVDATYEIAKRSHNWLKLKKDYLEGVGDTLDLVVLGGWFGKGKRTGSYGGFLLACYDDETEEFQTICKIGTGFKDEDLDNHSKFFKEHVITNAKSYYRYDHSLEPDVWFEPVQVWEVKCADLSISPVHKAAAGIVDPEKGISLRFPRFLRIRDDKKPEDATTSSEVANMYSKQEQVQSQKKNTTTEEDFY